VVGDEEMRGREASTRYHRHDARATRKKKKKKKKKKKERMDCCG
jgi:hypothetical protein